MRFQLNPQIYVVCIIKGKATNYFDVKILSILV